MVIAETSWVDRTFRVMGTNARVLALGGAPEIVDRAQDRLADLEQLWSRFRPDSELSLLNAAAAERPVVVSRLTFTLIAHAVEAWRRTAGRFDPTGLAALQSWGYDRDFPSVTGAAAPTSVPHESVPLTGCGEIRMDPIVRSVTLGPGVQLDLGGIGKGFAADLVAQDLAEAGVTAGCVDLGGDLRVVGSGPYDGAWRATFDDPVAMAQIGSLRFGAGAVATSTRLKRRWRRGGHEVHHLLDPHTGAPAASGVASVTVLAGAAWWAEVLAKAAFVAGPRDGVALLEAEGVDGFVVRDDGVVVETARLDQFCVREEPVAPLRS